MTFLFSYVCDLLEALDRNQRSGRKASSSIIEQWFSSHRARFLRDDFNPSPLLSTLLPEKRSDRVYSLQSKSLSRLIARSLGLGRSRLPDLGRWEQPGAGVDLGDCVERVLTSAPNAGDLDVTVEEIDRVLHKVASACHFSSPAVRGPRSFTQTVDRELELGDLFRHVSARDAKWLTRLILKNYEPVVLEPNTVYRGIHPLLPTILKVQDDLTVAGRFLQDQTRRRGVTWGDLTRDDLPLRLKPKLGVKVGRQTWLKGRSIKNCLDMSRGRISCEEKMDGEYCQIHVDLSKGRNCIQIFSKSGKDSTKDRAAVHEAIRRSLRLGEKSCRLKTGCILEGELLVYSDQERKILDFDKIRKHVSRSGVFLRTEQDSQPHPYEHLMMVYFDVLMIDDESLLGIRQSQRFKRLEELIRCETGHSQLVRRHIVDYENPNAASDLRRIFAKCITERGEGLVLKCDEPYFDFSTSRRPYASSCIKLKKEYIQGFGDVGDFAVVGARYDAAKAKSYDIPHVKWTHFYIACLDNKDEVHRWKRTPRFVVTGVVELNPTQMNVFMNNANPPFTTEDENESIILRIAPGIDNGKRPSAIFTEPPVLDIRCFSFHRAGNTDFLSPRFPMVNKIHFDRTYVDVISFSELQDIAKFETEMPPEPDSQELMGWIARLENADPHRAQLEEVSQTTTVSAISTAMTASSVQFSTPSQPENEPMLPVPESLLAAVSGRTDLVGQPSAAGPLTPPRSSAIITTNKEAPASSRGPMPKKKRPASSAEKTPRQSKARRVTPADIGSSSRPILSASSSQATPREALGDITESSQSRDNAGSGNVQNRRTTGVHSFYMPSLHNMPSGSTLSAVSADTAGASFHTAPVLCADPVTMEVPDSQDLGIRHDHMLPSQSAENQRTKKCIYSGDACPLRNISFLLAPCISSMPWLTEDLFSAHGITDFVLSPYDWNNGGHSSGASTPTASRPRSSMSDRTRRKKIALVEFRRKGAVDALFSEIEEAQLLDRKEKRVWVPVFDWKVMEALTQEEEKKPCTAVAGRLEKAFDMRSKDSIWKKYWVGLA